jgi:hypothetical protein
LLFHLFAIISWVALVPLCFVVGYFSHSSGFKEAEKLNRPVCKYEILTIPAKGGLSVVQGHELNAVGKLLERSVRKEGYFLTKVDNKDRPAVDGYKVIIRNTVQGWHKESGWVNTQWTRFYDSSDTLVGFVPLNDPDFHTKILAMQDEALSKAAVLESIA